MTNDEIKGLVAELRAPSTIDQIGWVTNRAADALEHLKRDLDTLSGVNLSLSTAQNMLQAVLPWKMFYGDGKTLGEIANHFNMSIYDFSPWLTAPATKIALKAAEEASAAREVAVERAVCLEKALREVLSIHGFDDRASEALIESAYAKFSKTLESGRRDSEPPCTMEDQTPIDSTT